MLELTRSRSEIFAHRCHHNSKAGCLRRGRVGVSCLWLGRTVDWLGDSLSDHKCRNLSPCRSCLCHRGPLPHQGHHCASRSSTPPARLPTPVTCGRSCRRCSWATCWPGCRAAGSSHMIGKARFGSLHHSFRAEIWCSDDLERIVPSRKETLASMCWMDP